MKLSQICEASLQHSDLSKQEWIERYYREVKNSPTSVSFALSDMIHGGVKKGDIPDEASFKEFTLKAILSSVREMKHGGSWHNPADACENVKKLGYDWPEIKVIEKSLVTA